MATNHKHKFLHTKHQEENQSKAVATDEYNRYRNYDESALAYEKVLQKCGDVRCRKCNVSTPRFSSYLYFTTAVLRSDLFRLLIIVYISTCCVLLRGMNRGCNIRIYQFWE